MVKVTFRSSRILLAAVAVIALTLIVVYGFGLQNTLHDMMLSDNMEHMPM